jgi:hypothetical protein
MAAFNSKTIFLGPVFGWMENFQCSEKNGTKRRKSGFCPETFLLT